MPKEKSKKPIRIIVSSYEVASLEKATANIIRKASELGLKFGGPNPLKRKREFISTIRSPHVYKNSWEQFEKIIYRRLICFFDTPFEKIIASYQQFSLPRAVEIKVKF